jgi:hypothetical protein
MEVRTLARMTVMKHVADDGKGVYTVILEGDVADVVPGNLLDAEMKIKGKTEDVLEVFPRGKSFTFDLVEKKKA